MTIPNSWTDDLLVVGRGICNYTCDSARRRKTMTKKPNTPTKVDTGALKHNPFAGLASKQGAVGACLARPSDAKPKPLPRINLSFSHETAGRSGKVVTRIRGLPLENLEAIAGRLRKAIGCGATVEGDDLLLLGMLGERAEQWLKGAGDLRKIVLEQPLPTLPKAVPGVVCPPASGTASQVSPTNRSDVRLGQRVAIVMKADQTSGALTEGIVRDLLTNSATHPRGIKVRLESGEIGRVKIVFG